LLQLLAEPIELDGGQLAKIGASVGIAVFPDDAKDLQSLCIEADLRMYDSKHDAIEPPGQQVIRTPTFDLRSNLGIPPALRRVTDR
jgi:GGDEF domain-containing protein